VPARQDAPVDGRTLQASAEQDRWRAGDAFMDPTHEIRFQSLFRERGLCFPCDAQGHVELDALSDRARENYLYARAVVGVEFAYPKVCPTAPAVG
jgi:hypothetical protein